MFQFELQFLIHLSYSGFNFACLLDDRVLFNRKYSDYEDYEIERFNGIWIQF